MYRMKQQSISWRLTISVLLFVTIMFVVAQAVVAWFSYNAIAEEATHATENRLDAMIKEIEMPLTEVEVSTKAGAQMLLTMHGDDSMLSLFTQSAVKQSDKVVGCAVAFAEGLHHADHWYAPYAYRNPTTGEVVSKQLGNPDYDYFSMEWFSVPFETGIPHWSNPYYDKDGGEQLMTTYSYPVKDAEGKVFAVITADIAIDWIDSLVRTIRPYNNSLTSILCPDNSVIGIDDPAILDVIRQGGGDDSRLQKVHDEMRKGGDSILRFRAGGHWFYIVYAPLRMGWSAAISCRYIDVLHSANEMMKILIFIGIVSILSFAIICYYAARHFTRPITDLSKAAIDMAHGNLQTPLPVINTHDEMLQLRDSFETMQHSLVNYIEELRTTTAAANRMEGELSVASDIQQGMLRSDFTPTLHALLEPAKEVGGDLYDFLPQPDGTLFFSVGDVAGKGAPAALMMSTTRTALRFVAGLGLDLGQSVGRVNNSIAEANSGEMFVTLFVGHINPATGTLHYCNAGHNPILVIPPDTSPYLLKAMPNLALGVLPDFQYVAEETTFLPGTLLVIYTDGVTEAEQEDHSQYGEERLLQWAASLEVQDSLTTSKFVAESLLASVRDFTSDTPQNDDITIMCIKI